MKLIYNSVHGTKHADGEILYMKAAFASGCDIFTSNKSVALACIEVAEAQWGKMEMSLYIGEDIMAITPTEFVASIEQELERGALAYAPDPTHAGILKFLLTV